MFNSEYVNRLQDFFNYYRSIEDFKKQFPDANWKDSLCKSQIKSKLWLIDEVSKTRRPLGVIFLLGGWYGTLARLMFEIPEMRFEKIRSFDIDKSCHEIAETINRPFVMDGWKFKSTTFDIMDITVPLTYTTLRRDGSECELQEFPDTIINTSCEHMASAWYHRIPNRSLFILQTNDFHEIEDHINCVDNIEEMKELYPMADILFEGELQLEGYKRFMLIGYK